MHGPRDSRASRRRWNTPGVPWGQFKAAKHCGQNMSTSSIANQSTRCSIARAGPGLIGRTWRACVGGGQGPRLAEHPQQPARRTWLSFRPTESLHTCTSIRSLRVEKKNIDPPCMGSIRTSSCPGVMPWDGSQGSHGSGRVRQFVNCLSHRNVRFF